MTNQNLTPQGPVQAATGGLTDVQSCRSGQISVRAAFRRSGIDLNPDLVLRVDAMESGVPYNDPARPLHWVLANPSLRSMVDSLVRDKRQLAYWQGLDCRRSGIELAEEMVRDLREAEVGSPGSVWAMAKFVAVFTARCVSMAIRVQVEIAAVKRQLRRAQVV